MLEYAEKFDDRGEIRWLPYLMYFHPVAHASTVVNTDQLGFRYSHGDGSRHASVGGDVPEGPVRILAGSSTVFGIGASCDQTTLSSRLWSKFSPDLPWLNLGGRSFNSTQELMLFLLHRHLIPEISDIVLFSGFNNLGLARFPRNFDVGHGAFFNCAEYFEAMAGLAERGERRSLFGFGDKRSVQPDPAEAQVLGLDEQTEYAAQLTARHLDVWRMVATDLGANLTYVLQPLAPWVREEPADEEKLIFAELDELSNFSQAYGEITTMEAGRRYADALRGECRGIGVKFVDFSPILAAAVTQRDWLFADRIHFTDHGHEIVASLLADTLNLI